MISVWAVWLGATLVGPAGLVPCPVHGSHASHSMSAPAPDMSPMAGMAETEQSGRHGSSGHQSNSHCTCVGACCCATTVAPPATQVAEITIDQPVSTARPVSAAADDRAPVSAPPHSLPFANGPPSQA